MQNLQRFLKVFGVGYILFVISTDVQAQFWGSPNVKGHALNYRVTGSLGDTTSIEQKSVTSIVRRKNIGEWRYAIHGPGFEIDVIEQGTVIISRFPNVYDKSFTFRGKALIHDTSENGILATGSSRQYAAVKGRVLLSHSGTLRGIEFSYKTEDSASNRFVGLAATEQVAGYFQRRVKSYGLSK